MKVKLVRRLPLAAVCALFLGACTELPNDVGVRPHRPEAAARRSADRRVLAWWQDNPAAKGQKRILINLTIQQAFFFRGDALIGLSSISSGRHDFDTPPGKYRVIQKDEHHVSSQYGEFVAASGAVLVHDADVNRDGAPRGAHFVGASMPCFLRFTGGYGMHAGVVPQFRASHGCVRLPVKMARHFFDTAEVGTQVEVVEPPGRGKIRSSND